ncbi:P-loop containing nucleoside triphosphate hydrolase protein [Hysterangium stoloniferum]|nr:P-loop containing nucleoside triphosphate hydrolase protein [Hysterangium stoloniferum]
MHRFPLQVLPAILAVALVASYWVYQTEYGDQKKTLGIFDQLLPGQFNSSTQYTQFKLVQNVLRMHPDMQHVVVETNLPLSEYIKSQNIQIKVTDHYRIHEFDQGLSKMKSTLRFGLGEFTWAETDFLLYKLCWQNELLMGVNIVYVLLFPSEGNNLSERRQIGEDLLRLAFEWSYNVNQEIWMFSNGMWFKDKKLWQAVQLADRANLVLNDEFTANLKRDTETFFSGREVYDSLEIPWKRGLLLLGPPGNGKTESIKVLLKENDKPALYVKSFKSSTEENAGILTIATSNHPELIDDSILNRPSRFDVKYTFELPTHELRKQYTELWIKKANRVSHVNFRDHFLEEIAEQTEGFSFAFMKELFVSYLLRTAHESTLEKGKDDPEATMRAQIKQLVAQIKAGEAQTE